MTVVGVVGLGDIGRGVASAAIAASLEVVVFDVRREAMEEFEHRAGLANSLQDLGERSDIVAVAVVTDDQVLEVVDDLPGMKSGSTIVLISTVGPATVRSVAERAAKLGAGVVDCGVSGGPSAAAEGTLVSMVGGADDDVTRAMPALEAFSSKVVRMGPLGAGLQAKLARNIVQYGSWLAAYEAQMLAEAAGIELAKLAEVIRASDKLIGGASRLMFRPTAKPFGPHDDVGLVDLMRSAAALAHKDLRAAMDLARELRVELPMTALADEEMDSVFGIGPR